MSNRGQEQHTGRMGSPCPSQWAVPPSICDKPVQGASTDLGGNTEEQSPALIKQVALVSSADANVLCGLGAAGLSLQHLDGTVRQCPHRDGLQSQPSTNWLRGREAATQGKDELEVAQQGCTSHTNGCSSDRHSIGGTCGRSADSGHASDSVNTILCESARRVGHDGCGAKGTAVNATSRAESGYESSSGTSCHFERLELAKGESSKDSDARGVGKVDAVCSADAMQEKRCPTVCGDAEYGHTMCADDSEWLQAQALRAQKAAEWQRLWDEDLQQRAALERCDVLIGWSTGEVLWH
jgi:hypothetical protein